ncbi:protein hu-li tai shao-like isoform X3 [Stegodyphus dumicola]|uniref:protein hu-li tai shao-like isoform X3 n=1 Tax=Stegodyphus dumicola TaxID=202533 RepID=UPI0015B29EFE|nr:protein hu-li tai shao-like isoform X3 [Stegodyphus dumicola]
MKYPESVEFKSGMADIENKPNGTIEENGPVAKYDPDDPESQKQMWRPPDIDQDMKEMERRKRVDMIMNSQVFREELERIIESQINEGYLPANLTALQQVTELLLPNRRSSGFRSGHCVIPINDIRGVDGIRYTKMEKLLRCKLAAVYRLIDLYGYSENIYNHITVRVSQDLEHFLLNPFGLQYPEVTASSLLKVDMQGNVVDPGSTSFTFNRAGFVLHSAVHAARPDVRCVIHIHHPPCVAVSAMKTGLLPVSQEAALIGDVSYHDYQGILVDTNEREQIARDLGPVNKVMILRNHGVIVCCESIEEALFYLQNLVLACEAQVRLMPIGLENIQIMSEEAKQKVRSIITENHAEVTGKPDGAVEEDKDTKVKKFKVWDLEFEAQMRMLDNAGFRTGYLYRYPLIRVEVPRQKNDVEVPPSATSFAQYFEEDKWLSPLRKLMEGKKTHEKLRWVNSPNVYQKVEVLETGTNDPKKITKWVEKPDIGDNDSWVQEGSPSHSTLVKIESPHQFIPKTGDPNEFKKKQKELKQNRMHSKITAGPQSSILDGVTWEEIKKMQDAQMTNATGDHVVLVGAASKGIIQREFQHNAMVYKTAYAKNPFDNISDQDLEEYKKIVERKQRGEPVEDDIPDHIKPLLLEPVLAPEHQTLSSPVQDLNTPPQSPASPCSDEEDQSECLKLEAAEEIREKGFQHRTFSERKPKTKHTADITVNGEEKLKSAESGEVSAASRSSKESSPVKELGDESLKKDKKKKKGLRTPSFLKKKKHKKEKEDKEKVAS